MLRIMQATIRILSGAIVVLSASVAAQNNDQKKAPVFVSLDAVLPAGGIRLAGGQEADADDWKSIAISITDSETCTASLVGPQVILTSAHCIDSNPVAPLAVVRAEQPGAAVFGGKTYIFDQCELHPDYAKAAPNGRRPRSAQDFALCKLKNRVSSTIAADVIETDYRLQRGDPVVLLGYGCAKLKVENYRLIVVKDPDGKKKLRIGDQIISRTGAKLHGTENLFLVTETNGDRPTICPGDSGGPVLVGINERNASQGRSIAAVNAAFDDDVSVLNPILKAYSYLAPLSFSFQTWAKSWSEENGAEICGFQLKRGVSGCRR